MVRSTPEPRRGFGGRAKTPESPKDPAYPEHQTMIPRGPVLAANPIMKLRVSICSLVMSLSAIASAESKVSVSPQIVRPGDPVLISVTGSTDLPKGTVAGEPLRFFAAKTGFQAVMAIPLDAKADKLAIEIDSVKLPVYVRVLAVKFAETKVVVDEGLADPSKAEGARIDRDNYAIIGAAMKLRNEPQFTRPFYRPQGQLTSPFGEWRTFNDGYRSQHLGIDLYAREGAKVLALNAGTVTLVRETFLAGNVIVIGHGAGIATAYFHLSKATVAVGDVVKQGAPIGLIGHTGRTTGPHLHISVRVPGGFVDPAAFFKLKLAPRAPTIARP
jgi:murein DD-endopeptidase MepM/ murein hydrolase activator NlpD